MEWPGEQGNSPFWGESNLIPGFWEQQSAEGSSIVVDTTAESESNDPIDTPSPTETKQTTPEFAKPAPYSESKKT